ncbi:AIR synthase-related protein, partial [Vibrio natriegens]
DWMCKLNTPGADFAEIAGVKAMTDVTGFGLMGHLNEICEGSGLKAEVWFDRIPHLPGVFDYIEKGCVPGGTHRNFDSYGHRLGAMSQQQQSLLCDPQTSGG